MKNFVARELAAIDSLDGAMASEPRPDYVTLFRHAKDGHQQAVGQLSALLRLVGDQPAQSPGVLGAVAKLQTQLMQHFSRALTLMTARSVEHHLAELYAAARDGSPGTLAHEVFTKLAAHGMQRWHILTAHLALSTGSSEAARELPRPLSEYFAGDTARACMRCMLDRPGQHRAIERHAPYTYICAACHDEMRAAFPAELAPMIDLWPRELRHARIVEKALGKPAAESAKRFVHTVLSGQVPELRGAVRHKSTEGCGRLAPPVRTSRPASQLADEEATPAERAYSERLFDPKRLRASW